MHEDIISRLQKMLDDGIGFINTVELARLRNESPEKLEKERCYGQGVVFTRIGSNIRYAIGDVINWIKTLPRFVSTSQTVEDAQRKRSVEERDADRKQEVSA